MEKKGGGWLVVFNVYIFFFEPCSTQTHTHTHHMWWPESSVHVSDDDTPEDSSKTFPIHGTECSQRRVQTECCPEGNDCNSPTNACAWLPRENKCSAKGLWVQDKNGSLLELDTGSSIIALSPTYCDKQHLKTYGSAVPESYGSTPDANPTPTQYPHTILGTLTQPTCTKRQVAGVPSNGGLVGLRPASNRLKIPYSFMDTIPEGERKVSVDKASKRVCFGTKCPALLEDKEERPFVKAGERSLLGFPLKNQYILLDTGSTQTWKMNDEICILGNNDILSLYVDYDNSTFKYEIDDKNIEVACGPNAKSGNWNA